MAIESPIRADHDIDQLDRRVDDIRAVIKRLDDDETLLDLIRFWHQPGWTTPAEFRMIDRSLLHVERQLALVQEQLGDIRDAAAMVGRG